jgi:hypothetical protein
MQTTEASQTRSLCAGLSPHSSRPNKERPAFSEKARRAARRAAKHALRDDSEHGWSWEGEHTPLTEAERRELRRIRHG